MALTNDRILNDSNDAKQINHSTQTLLGSDSLAASARGIKDDFAWLRAADWPKVSRNKENVPIFEFLKKANQDFANFIAPHNEEKKIIADKIAQLSQENNYTVPFFENGYYYFSRVEAGQDYWTHFRKIAAHPNLSKDELDALRAQSPSDYAKYLHSLLELGRPLVELSDSVLLDEPAMVASAPSGYFCIDNYLVSPDNQWIAYAIDNKGAERYDILIRRIKDGAVINFIQGAWPNFAWRYDSAAIYYVPCDDDWRARQVRLKTLLGNEFAFMDGGVDTTIDSGREAEQDILLYEEADQRFNVSVASSRSKNFVYINCKSHTHNEVLVILNQNPDKIIYAWQEQAKIMWKTASKPWILLPRQDNIIYSLAENGEFFFLVTNDQGDNCRLAAVSIAQWMKGHLLTGQQNALLFPAEKLQGLIGVSEEFIEDLHICGNFLAVKVSKNGLPKIKMFHVKHEHQKDDVLKLEYVSESQVAEVAYTINILDGGHDEPELRYSYSSPICPGEIWMFCWIKKSHVLLKKVELADFVREDYVVERHYVQSDYRHDFFAKNNLADDFKQEKLEPTADNDASQMREKVKIPVTLVYKRERFEQNRDALVKPLLLYGYGAYGLGVAPHFRASIIPLLDAGFVYAIAHIRGGDELGLAWHKAGKLLNKKCTFEDFADVCSFLIDHGYSNVGDISIMGGSAGGMLMGYMVNNYAKLLRAVLALVPFVDVLNTMLDPSLPLTQDEYIEWGDPNQPEYFNYIASYSPYENLPVQNYPHILASAGFEDPRVGYWEAAKWYAKINDVRLNNTMLLLKTDMAAGHMGQNARRHIYEEMAEYWLFLMQSYAST